MAAEVKAPVTDSVDLKSNFSMPEPASLQGARDDAFGIGALASGMDSGGKSGGLENAVPEKSAFTQALDDISDTGMDVVKSAESTPGKLLDANSQHLNEVPNSLSDMQKDYGLNKNAEGSKEGQTEKSDHRQMDAREGVAFAALDMMSKGDAVKEGAKADTFEGVMSAAGDGPGLNHQNFLRNNPNPHVFDGSIEDKSQWT